MVKRVELVKDTKVEDCVREEVMYEWVNGITVCARVGLYACVCENVSIKD